MSGWFWNNYERTCAGCEQSTRGGWCPDLATAACVVPDMDENRCCATLRQDQPKH